MIVRDLHIERVAPVPPEADPPLIVDADAAGGRRHQSFLSHPSRAVVVTQPSVHSGDSAPTRTPRALLRADRPGHAHTQPGARRAGRPRSRARLWKTATTAPGPTTSLSRAGSYMPPVAAGRAPSGGGHRSSGVTRGLPVGRARSGWRSGGEAEGGRRRGDRAGRHLGPTRRTLPCWVGCTAPHAGAWPPGGLSQADLAAPAPRPPPPPRSRGSSRSLRALPNILKE